MNDPAALIESLHPLEVKVLGALGATSSPAGLHEPDLAQAAGLEPSQLSMAIGWLLSKGLVEIKDETIQTFVSLTDIGEEYFEKYAPIERILSTLKQAQQTGKRVTVQDLQAAENLEPTQLSNAIGALKKEGAIRIVPGGIVEATGTTSRTAETLRALLQQLHKGKRELSSFSEPMQEILKLYAVKRGNTREPFRL